ncbi:MAG: hypothetical protein J6X48_01510 [Lachnospiraceae bacterium]|nr:hypothetical protein [Lachnospiraceae bacterium]
MTLRIVNCIKHKYFFSFLTFSIVFMVLKVVEKYELTDSVRILFNGINVRKSLLIAVFVLFTLLIQYVNVDAVRLFLREDIYVLIRYKSKKTVFLKLQAIILLVDFLLVVTVAPAILSSYGINAFRGLNVAELMGVLIGGFLLSVIYSLLFVVLTVKCSETRAFVGMIAMALLSIGYSRIGIAEISFFPNRDAFNSKWICFLIILILYFVSWKLINKKEEIK